MKRLLPLLLFSLIINVSNSQEYLPFPDSAAAWTNFTGTIAGMQADHFCTAGDTTINELEFTKINHCNIEYKGAIRSDSGKVFYIPGGESEEFLLYDFTLQEGDSVTFYTEVNYHQTGFLESAQAGVVDSVLFGGVYRKRIAFEWHTWIEGIGCSAGLFGYPLEILEYGFSLLCMSENNSQIYPTANEDPCGGLSDYVEDEARQTVVVYPNPSTAVFNLKGITDLSPSNITVVNSVGQSIELKMNRSSDALRLDLSEQPPGIYLLRIENENTVHTKKLLLE